MASLPLDTVLQGDCLELLRTLPDASVDAVVTDPPSGIAFMGKSWDTDKGGRDQWIAWLAEVMTEALRVLKPGGHALVWALPRTSHWTATALEDAGFEIRDRISHIFGQGFPKSLNLHGEHEGWGTALKPAVEDWWLCRKTLAEGSVAANVLAHGTGALNIEACRVGSEPAFMERKGQVSRGGILNVVEGERVTSGGAGRWPANLLLSHAADCGDPDGSGCADGCPVRELDAQSGERPTGKPTSGNTTSTVNAYGRYARRSLAGGGGDSGGASRFYPTFRYVAKASRRERNAGCEQIEEQPIRWSAGTQNPGSFQSPNTHRAASNHHPTVKPLTLMQWLCRLITPPGGIVLDPFAGSGSTCVAAIREGFRCIGIEREAEYIAIANARIAHAQREPMQAPTARKPSSTKKRVAVKRQKSAPVARPSLWEGVGA